MMPTITLGRVAGYTDRIVHLHTLGGPIDLPYLSTYTPTLDETVTIQDGVVIGAVIESGPVEGEWVAEPEAAV